MLRTVFSSEVSVTNPWTRTIIPAVFQMLRRCNATDVGHLHSILDLSDGASYYDKLNNATGTATQVFDTLNSYSDLLMNLIKVSELWTHPTPTWEDEKELDGTGISLGTLNTATRDTQLPPVDYSSIELASFTYKPDQYYRKHAKIPDGASVMMMNGKLDFQTIHEWAVDQYENMEGDNKMLVEFENGPHCPGYSPTTAEDDTNCGARIIASYIAVGGDVVKTDTSCMAELPAINFESDF